MVNMIIYDDNGEPIYFDGEFNHKEYLAIGSDVKQTCNVAIRSKKGIPMLIFAIKELPYTSSLKEKNKDKCKNYILQNLKNRNVKISLLEMFETCEEHILALFKLLNGIVVDTNISSSLLVVMIGFDNKG